jgi:hypothetical protein
MPVMIKELSSEPSLAGNAQFLLSLSNTVMYVALVMLVLIMMLFSCVIGVLFVKFKEHIPGSSITRKSVVFSLILLAISLAPGLRILLAPGTSAVYGSEFFPLQMESYALTFVEYVVLGWLFGYLLERRLKPKGI